MTDHIIYEKKEVFIHDQSKQAEEAENGPLIESNKIGGRLQICKNKNGSNLIRFLPYGQEQQPLEDWALVGGFENNSIMTFNKDREDISIESKASNNLKLQFEMHELNSVRRIYPGYGIPSIMFYLNDGTKWPALYFHKGGSKEFLQELKHFCVFSKDAADSRLWSVMKPNGQAFQQSLYELSLFKEQRDDVVKKFVNAPIQSTLLSFSKITNIVRDVLKPSDTNTTLSTSTFDPTLKQTKPSLFESNEHGHAHTNPFNHNGDDISELIDSMTSDNIHLSNNDGFEMVTKVDLGPMPNVQRGAPVGKLLVLYDKEGRVQDVELLKRLIFKGGVDPSIRCDLWKFLLNYYDWSSPTKVRNEKRKLKVDDYYRMKLQWKSITDEQKLKFSLMRERENLIEKDVQRTDRTHAFFEGDDNDNLVMMKDILMTYNMYNFDLGYVQGMSDLLSVIMVIMENEVDSFWSFAGFMNKIESNFLMDQLHIKLQLANIRVLLDFVDSKFSLYLEKNESSNMYFCFRWILILFKREFTFPDIMRLWEILWTDLPCKNFHLLIVISILLMKKDDIMSNNFGFNEILKFVNDLSTRIDLEKTLQYAEGLYIQLSSFKSLPAPICEILGFAVQKKDDLDLDLVDDKMAHTNLTSSPRSSNQALNEIEERPLTYTKDLNENDSSIEVLSMIK